MTRVLLEDVSKWFGSIHILRNIDLSIEDGELIVLVGPSGCGKSTLLRMIAGLESVSSGTIAIDDRVVNEIDPRERDVAMVFQSYALYPHKTVFENITFGLKMRKVPLDEMRRRADKASIALGLKDYLDRYPRQLSGGQRQRVAMGRALVREPKAFLFDEPLSNLDAQLRVQMRLEIRSLQQQLRTTSVYVTHDQIEAMTMGDRIAVMHGGDIVQVGAPLEIYDHPATIFVSTFIGSPAINLLDGSVDGNGCVVCPGVDLARYGTIAPTGHRGKRVVVGIRPEHLAIGTHGSDGFVEAVEHTGLDTLSVVDVEGQKLRYLARGRASIAVGDRISLQADPGKIHLFDAITSERITDHSGR